MSIKPSLMNKIILNIALISVFSLSACVSDQEWIRLFEAKAEALREVCGKYRRVAANDEARVGMTEECLMQTKYQYAQINTKTSRFKTTKQFVYLSIQGTFTRKEYVYVENGIVKRVPKLLPKKLK